MKILILIVCMLPYIILNVCGVILGAIPTFLLVFVLLSLSNYLCKLWDARNNKTPKDKD